MSTSTLLLLLTGLSLVAYYLGIRRSLLVAGAGGRRALNSLPVHYGMLAALWCLLPALVVVLLWTAFQESVITRLLVAALPPEQAVLNPAELTLVINDIKNLAVGNIVSGLETPALRAAADHYLHLRSVSRAALVVIATVLAMLGTAVVWRRISTQMLARNHVESIVKILLILSSALAIVTTVGIVLSVLFESIRFFELVPLTEFLFGLHWSPQGSPGAFGAVPLFAGTLLISAIAMLVAVPIGLMSAIYLSEYAARRVRAVAKPLLEVLAGIPTVVYGVFAALTLAPLVRAAGAHLGLEVASESALVAGLVMGIMIIPFVSSLSDDFINAVPQSLRDGSYALGSTRSEAIKQVVIPAALPGIVGGILLAASRAIGETMIVVLAAGLAANLTANPLEAVTTVTVQIVTLLVGDQEFDSAKTLAAFALGLVLFVATLILNVIALHVVRKYREQYE
ncbi:MAG TPA: phosphate ABC transporter permease subunit PstC [Gammaproteobacteria bacterium]|nr:phosphate ABC transporter permease subunit PstC [Gammaproteobacteria bacterium]